MSKTYADYLPPMLFGDELKQALTMYPEYKTACRELPAGQRILQLMDLYKVFVPSSMAMEIYHKLYMITVMSLQQKGTVDSIRQGNMNHSGEYCGVITGASSVTIIGDSGIGKTTCIQKAVRLLGPTIEIQEPLQKIVPAVMVSCPFDCSYKGLLYQVLVSLDETLGTDYYNKAMKANVNAQQIMSILPRSYGCKRMALYGQV